MDNREPPIYRVAYELTIAITRYVKDCHQDYKLTLGQTLQKAVLDLQTGIYRINESADRLAALQHSINDCFFIRMILRLLLDINIMKLETSIALNLLLEEVSKQLGGWRKSLL